MSRRKQEKPQPRKNLVIDGEDLTQDYLTCGVCQRDFPLCDIVRFIQHKVRSCNNKENNNNCLSKLFGYAPDDSDSEDETIQSSKEVCNKDPDELEHKVVVSSAINTLKNTAASAKDNKVTSPKEPDKFGQCNYVCSTCKQPHSSAWSLLQHVQNHHGLKIYVESNHILNSDTSEVKTPEKSTHTSPQSSLRAPLLERQLDSTPLFPRSSSQELRLDLLGLSSTNSLVDSSPPPLLEVHQLDMPPNTSSLAISNEPQLDFYSKRLRELAGATSPNALIQMKLLQPNIKAVVNNKPNTHSTNSNERNHQGTNCNNPSQLPQSSASSTTSENPPSSPKANPKSCEFCGKSFRFMSNLIVHRRSHTGEKPFKCHVCNHACTQASKLKRHMKTHKRKKKSSSSDKLLALSEPFAKNGIHSDETSTVKNHEAQTNGESEYLSDDPGGTNHVEDEAEEDEEEEIDIEDEEVDEEDDDDDLSQPKLVVDQERDDDMVAQDLSKKPMKNGTSESNGVSKDERKGKGHNAVKHSLLSEVMENIGLASIQQYSEAYKQALKESSALKHDRHSDGSASNDGANHLERPSREGTRSAGQSPIGFNTGLLSAFDQNMGVKRIKLEDHWRKDKDENSLYAGLWIPSSHSMSSYKDLYSSDGSDRRKSKNESALVCMSPSSVRSSSPRPGTSNSLCTLGSIANSLLKPKDQRRNDTCEFCGKVFKNCSNLTVHRRSHTGEKPYKCELCSYACAQSSKLTRHMKTHGRMGKDVYRCRFCDMPFSVPSTLEKHMRKCVVSQSVGTSSYLLTERESDSKEMIPYCPRDSDC